MCCVSKKLFSFTTHTLANLRQSLNMDHSSKKLLLIVSITIFFTGCCITGGTVSNISQTNWTDAQRNCRKEGKLLSNLLTHAVVNGMYFWTGYFSLLSEWIKIIGCFEEAVVNTLTKRSYEMYFPSAGRCQEVCLASNYSVFGLQLKKCVCLDQIPEQGRRGANDCSLSCSERYPAETNIKFKKDCGGNQTYSLFKSGSKNENSAFTKNECLYIQCPTSDKKYIEHECNIEYSQICNEKVYAVYKDWQSSSVECKLKHNSYLLGDVDLTDPMQACNLIQGHVTGPSWLGIARELYISNDGDSMVQIEPKPLKCLKCNSDDCTFVDCNEANYFVCLEGPETTFTTPTGTTTSSTLHGTVSNSTSPTGSTTSTTLHGTISTSTFHTGTTTSITPHGTVGTEQSNITVLEVTENVTGSTNKKRESLMRNQDDSKTTVILIAVPVTVIIIIIGLTALSLVTLWRRRQRKKSADTKHGHHEPNLPSHSEKSDTNQSFQNNYFVLDKTETYSVVNSVNHAKDKGRTISNKECSDDDYDHLGENVREVEEEDNYHHAFFPINEDEADYGTCIRNMSAECLMENPYSHTNTGAHHVTLEDNDYNTISINA